MTNLLIQLHEFQSKTFAAFGGEHWFLVESLILAAVICKWGIPITTDLMVNASAGLAGKHFGDKSRTLVINASTNNPELANMMVSLSMGRVGGIANPLGSNFANIYLMYLVAPIWVAVKWIFKGQYSKVGELCTLIGKEKKLVAGHVLMATILFGFSSVMYWFITGYNQFSKQSEGVELQPTHMLLTGAAVAVIGLVVFRIWDLSMKRKRPELFDDIDDDDHSESWRELALGTIGLIFVSLLLNGLFLSWSELYSVQLSGILGAAVFAGLHYFVGALVTSLPELKVAVDNYEKLSAPDLNTALSSASVSNMTNLAIAILGLLIVGILTACGVSMKL
jgi:hypothetical protein